eukprot:Nk52_evm12s304 gene=Nk52_evmTU12s304
MAKLLNNNKNEIPGGGFALAPPEIPKDFVTSTLADNSEGKKFELDRSLFTRELKVLALRTDPSSVGKFIKERSLNRCLLHIPRYKHVHCEMDLDREMEIRRGHKGLYVGNKDELFGFRKEATFQAASKKSKRLILLRAGYETEEAFMRECVDGEGAEEAENGKGGAGDGGAARKFLMDNAGIYEFVQKTIVLDYNYWSTEDILKACLPADIEEIPASFEKVGHIAHVNLRDDVLPYKYFVGTVLLDKNPSIGMVVNKLDSIDTTFRFFKMEVLAGEGGFIADVKENGCRFKLDYSCVYWNSRLLTEHKRLVDSFHKNDLVCDMFAGVGPFAVPAGKKKIRVLANDLNPDSYKYLKINLADNSVDKHVSAYNMDAREFPKHLMLGKEKTEILNTLKEKRNVHFIMNLPKTAIEFLDAFSGLFSLSECGVTPNMKLPFVHCYCFLNKVSEDPVVDAIDLIEPVMAHRLKKEDVKIHLVRCVSPKKNMYCVSFRLPWEVTGRAPEAPLKRKASFEPANNGDSKKSK